MFQLPVSGAKSGVRTHCTNGSDLGFQRQCGFPVVVPRKDGYLESGERPHQPSIRGRQPFQLGHFRRIWGCTWGRETQPGLLWSASSTEKGHWAPTAHQGPGFHSQRQVGPIQTAVWETTSKNQGDDASYVLWRETCNKSTPTQPLCKQGEKIAGQEETSKTDPEKTVEEKMCSEITIVGGAG